MKKHFSYCLLALLVGLLFSCQQNTKPEGILADKDVKKIALLGGSLISSMENHGFFEMSMIQHFPKQEISFRNIGWAGDDVYGLARSQFGSAQNTRSWQPPSAEKGFGSKILWQHIETAAPTTLIIGYGSEAAFSKDESDFSLFTSGYKRLINFVDSLGVKLILLSPPKQEAVLISKTDCEKRNVWLAKATEFIKSEAESGDHLFIDLYTHLITDPNQQAFTDNGIQLNRIGYAKMNTILLESLGIEQATSFSIKLDEEAGITNTQNCKTTDWAKTVYGASFNLKPDLLHPFGTILSKEPVAIFINGELYPKSQDTITYISLKQDSLNQRRLIETIKEKNRLHRYRLRPLNEAYIYLFRRHEMGHLAYEMEDLDRLVEEKEREIKRLLTSQTYDIEIELIRPWQPPKNYPEDEVPAFIPEPDIEKEIAAFIIPEGYEINLFAADPMIANPINVNWDTKGRAWVATSSTYPHIVPGREPNDRIIILEDTDKDGIADKHTVFAENLLVPHSVMPVPGGAYVTATTQVLFLADTDGDDIADEQRVIFDGFGNADVHHMIHGLRWAPWGNLYFTQSIYINTFIETAHGTRILNGSGIWSFRPETGELDVFSRGIINPWGHAFDEWGQAFATDGAGSSGINYVFPESAHATAVGAARILPGLNSGTPKNTAAEVVYSRHFPPQWQGSVITNDFRANRTVRYQLQAQESGYLSEEVETIIRSDHRSYRPVDTKIGPDGALYIVDWYNPIIDHGEVDFHHPVRDKTHGRIWRLTKKGSPLVSSGPNQGVSMANLLNLLKSPEQFTRLQANRALVEQNCDPQIVVDWIKRLSTSDSNFERNRLEGFWLLTALNYYDEQLLQTLLRSSNPQVRAAAVRMLAHWKKQAENLPVLEKGINDNHPQVRLETLHALRELGNRKAVEIAINILDHPMDENLDFAAWLTISGLQKEWLPAFVNKEPIFDGVINKQMYALLTSDDPSVVAPIDKLLDQPGLDSTLNSNAWLMMAKLGGSAARSKVLEKAAKEENDQMLRAMVNAPSANDAVPNNVELLEQLIAHDSLDIKLAALRLVGRWNVHQYTDLVSQRVNEAPDPIEKIVALRTMVALGQLEEVKKMTKPPLDQAIRATACAVWIEEETEQAVEPAIELLASLDSLDLAELIFRTFQRMEEGPEILEKALVDKTLPENIASVGLKVVQTSGLNLFTLDEALRKAGNIQAIGMKMSKEDKAQLLEDAIESGSLYHGRQIYRRKELLCATCHRVNGIGGLSGPDLTTVGSYMTPNSILESVLDPSTDIKQGYETVLITKTNGELLSGLLHRKTNTATLLRLPNSEIISIPAEEIKEVDVSPVSLMPAGLTRNLHKDELKDLLAYLINLGKEID